MPTDDKPSLLSALLPAITGLLGVVVGGVLAGYFQLQATKVTTQTAAASEAARTSRENGQALMSASAEYLSTLSQIATLTATETADDTKVAACFRDLQSKAFSLALRTSLPTSQKIIRTTVVAANTIASPRDAKARETFTKSIADAYVALYFEVARFRWRGSPEGATDELLYSITQLIEAQPQPTHAQASSTPVRQ